VSKLSELLEKVTCGRCGGSGHYSFNMMHGTVCYGCGGSGVKLTKRGQAAKDYWTWLCTMDCRWLRVGDRVFQQGGGYGLSGWCTVTAIEDNAATQNGSGRFLKSADDATEGSALIELEGSKYSRLIEDGYRFLEYSGLNITLERKGQKSTLGGWTGSLLTGTGDAEMNATLLKAVAAYQASLTKQGKVSKRKAAA